MGEKKACNMSASWIGNMKKENETVKKQEWENITVLELKAELTKPQKWKLPGIDKVPNFWLNTLSSSHLNLQVYRMKLCKTWKKVLNGCARKQHIYLLKAMTQKTLKTIDQSLVFQQPTNFYHQF